MFEKSGLARNFPVQSEGLFRERITAAFPANYACRTPPPSSK
jgi:hypothetical protein